MKFPQFPQEIDISYFSDVKNAGQIRTELLAGNPDYQVAFINANTLLSSKHLLAAVYRAVSDQDAGSMKTKNVHSEVLFCLGGNNNIMDSLRRFGIQDDTTNIVAVKVGGGDYKKLVEGTEEEFTDEQIAKNTDLKLVKKVYKLPGTVSLEDRAQVETAALGALLLRGYS